ncbi:helix-turn-helix domain-containing protein [Propionispora hippei]|uniref:Zn-dependent peptidase ImmA, M78 family n=1 Tax=Propionispora hippei DSM 15287 TaxID=1123003 RepID=A0A1M6GHQ2_9FIRM|nr:XRE family transcriptional regulator [Propionispora hippei]SHJ09402.1 Zn-dependent peptidase ImmA, M78 family [Propionispora hippei DSM 15287]
MDKRIFNGKRLKNGRLFRGLTLTELADRTGISKQSLSLYENERNTPEHERVQALASSLSFPYDFFFQTDACETVTEVTYFRSLASATKMNRTSQSVKLEYVAKMYEVLLEYIDFPALNLPDVTFDGSDDEFDDKSTEDTQRQIESISQQIREFWGIGDAPIKNLQFLLEKNGIIVTGFDTLEDKIDAFSQRTIVGNNDMYFIAVALGKRPEGRIRFDMAHELGHLLLHPWSENLELITKEEFKVREKQANMFASALLLPQNSFGKDVQAYPTDLKYYQFLKKKWKASIQAMVYRSNQLGIITDNQFQYMMRQISKNGWRTKEPGDVSYALKENIFQGAIDLLIEEKILNPASILRTFKQYGITLYRQDIEELLHLREGTLYVEESKPQIIQLKRPDDTHRGNE